ATARGLRGGQPVELFNDVGTAPFTLRVSDETPRGVAFVPGQRPSGEAHAGTINNLCSTGYSGMGQGGTYEGARGYDHYISLHPRERHGLGGDLPEPAAGRPRAAPGPLRLDSGARPLGLR